MTPLYEVLWKQIPIVLEWESMNTIVRVAGYLTSIVECDDTMPSFMVPYLTLRQSYVDTDIIIPLFDIVEATI